MVPLLCSKQGPASPELAEVSSQQECSVGQAEGTLLETAPQFRIPKRATFHHSAWPVGASQRWLRRCCIHHGLLRRTKERACAENKCRHRFRHLFSAHARSFEIAVAEAQQLLSSRDPEHEHQAIDRFTHALLISKAARLIASE